MNISQQKDKEENQCEYEAKFHCLCYIFQFEEDKPQVDYCMEGRGTWRQLAEHYNTIACTENPSTSYDKRCFMCCTKSFSTKQNGEYVRKFEVSGHGKAHKIVKKHRSREKFSSNLELIKG